MLSYIVVHRGDIRIAAGTFKLINKIGVWSALVFFATSLQEMVSMLPNIVRIVRVGEPHCLLHPTVNKIVGFFF